MGNSPHAYYSCPATWESHSWRTGDIWKLILALYYYNLISLRNMPSGIRSTVLVCPKTANKGSTVHYCLMWKLLYTGMTGILRRLSHSGISLCVVREISVANLTQGIGLNCPSQVWLCFFWNEPTEQWSWFKPWMHTEISGIYEVVLMYFCSSAQAQLDWKQSSWYILWRRKLRQRICRMHRVH